MVAGSEPLDNVQRELAIARKDSSTVEHSSGQVDLSFWQLWNICFGFFGIQLGWGLQMANSSAIFESLGAQADQLPMLWLAAPMTGLVVQPLVGYWSDRTYSSFGRRRPYFLLGAVLSSVALVLMPTAPTLWMAAGLLWLLDAAANISMTPFRSFIADLVPEHQQTRAFTLQGVAMGAGAVIASVLPWVLAHVFPQKALVYHVPFSVRLSFYIGAVAFLGAVTWTMVRASKPFFTPIDLPAGSIWQFGQDMVSALLNMPPVMRQLAWIQGFSWLGMFCIFLYFPPAVAHNFFGAQIPGSALYERGIEWAGVCMAVYNLVCCISSIYLPQLTRWLALPKVHGLCLLCGAVGLIGLAGIHHPLGLLLPMVAVGVAFASMLSLPYAMLVPALPPAQSCLYLGVFNCFIVIPEIVAALGLGWFMSTFLQGDRLSVVVFGGVCMAIGAALSYLLIDTDKNICRQGR